MVEAYPTKPDSHPDSPARTTEWGAGLGLPGLGVFLKAL